jgi:DNA polymerase III alpha subunit
MLDLAREFKDPILISDDAHFAHPDDKIVQDVRLRQSGSWRFFGSYHRQSSEEAFAYFKDAPRHRAGGVRGLGREQPRVGVPVQGLQVQGPQVPADEVLPEGDAEAHHGVGQEARAGWTGTNPKYVARLRAEINLLHKNGTIDLLPYFMIDEEVCSLYEKNNRLTGPGRGSAAGLLLTYLLGITHVDPLRFDLSMDRFMTRTASSPGSSPTSTRTCRPATCSSERTARAAG